MFVHTILSGQYVCINVMINVSVVLSQPGIVCIRTRYHQMTLHCFNVLDWYSHSWIFIFMPINMCFKALECEADFMFYLKTVLVLLLFKVFSRTYVNIVSIHQSC